MKFAAILIFLLLLGAIAFELLPATNYARIVIPEEIYLDTNCSCDCISQSRPWYSTFNHWFWLWVFVVPIFVFSIKPEINKWKKMALYLIAIVFCYGIMNLALHLMWDIRNAPFIVNSDPAFPNQKTWDIPNCANIADGANLTFALYLGWIPASLYVGIWFLIHRFFRGSVSKKSIIRP